MLPIIDSTVAAAPVLVQEKPQARVDVAHIPEDATTVFGKRGYELDGLDGLLKLLNQLGKPEDSSAARPSPSSPSSGPAGGRTDVDHSLPFNPDEPSLASSPGHAQPGPGSLTESQYEPMDWEASVPSDPASSTMSTAGHGLMGSHALPNPGLSTVSDHEMVDALPSPIESDIEMADVPPSRSSTNPDRQSVGVGSSSSSGGRKKPFRPQKTVIF